MEQAKATGQEDSSAKIIDLPVGIIQAAGQKLPEMKWRIDVEPGAMPIARLDKLPKVGVIAYIRCSSIGDIPRLIYEVSKLPCPSP